MNRTLRALFFLLFVRPLVLLVLGVNARHRERLPTKGPAIIAANHNSHLDTLVLMTLFPQAMLPVLRPVAAADYFLRHRLLAWFARRIIGIVPLSRSVKPGDPADQGGVKADDVIIALDGMTLDAPSDLQRVVSSTPVGKRVRVVVLRAGEQKEMEVTIGRYQERAERPSR